MFSWRRKAPRERRRRKHLGGSGGMLSQEIFKIEYSETPFPAFLEPRKQFPRQCWRSLKFSLKSKLLNENGQFCFLRSGENYHFYCSQRSTVKHSFRIIMPFNLSCFLLAVGTKNSLILFILSTVWLTQVACFTWGFPSRLGRAGMRTK